jgi:hypothetical protein
MVPSSEDGGFFGPSDPPPPQLRIFSPSRDHFGNHVVTRSTTTVRLVAALRPVEHRTVGDYFPICPHNVVVAESNGEWVQFLCFPWRPLANHSYFVEGTVRNLDQDVQVAIQLSVGSILIQTRIGTTNLAENGSFQIRLPVSKDANGLTMVRAKKITNRPLSADPVIMGLSIIKV